MYSTYTCNTINVSLVSEHLADVVHTLGDVCLPLPLLGVVGLDEDGGVGVQGQLHHLPAHVRQVSQPPQELQDLHTHTDAVM